LVIDSGVEAAGTVQFSVVWKPSVGRFAAAFGTGDARRDRLAAEPAAE
jgi:hypothetical protein